MEISLPKSIKKILFFDTETNNLPTRSGDFSNVELLEISMMLYSLEDNTSTLENTDTILISHPESVKIENSHIHGITSKIIKEKGISVRDSIDTIFFYIDKCDLIVCHNSSFDINVLKNFFEKYNSDYIYSLMERKKIFDTMCDIPTIKRIKLKELYNLLFKKYFQNSHSAFYDCKAMSECFFKVCGISYVEIAS